MNEISIQRVCETEFGQPPLKITRKKIGMCNEVYELHFETKSYILRMNNEKEWIYGTHKFLPLFQELNIKVPSIISADYSKTKFSFCYQIQTKIEGKDLLIVFNELSPSELKAIAGDLSLIFDKFNALPYEKNFGGITGVKEEQIENLFTIIEDKRKRIVQRNGSTKVIDKEVVEMHNELVEDYKEYFLSARPKLYYDDLNSKNVMIHHGKFNGLVDLDFLMKGDYLDAIGGIIAAWYGTESGEIYINEIFKLQRLDEFQQKMAKVYAIFHLLMWTSEEGVKFNGNSTGEINWLSVEKKKRKIISLYNSIKS